MASVGDFQTASKIIHGFKSTESLPNLSRYHTHQTRLLSAIFTTIEKEQIYALVQNSSTKFLTDIPAINRLIHRLERTLVGGSFLLHTKLRDWNPQKLEKINKSIEDARAKDDAKMGEEIENLLKKFRSKKRFWQQPPEHCLYDLFPGLKDHPESNEGSRMFAFESFLSKFAPVPSKLSTLVNELKLYVDSKLDGIAGGREQFNAPKLQVLRRPSGSIIRVLLGSRTRDTIRMEYSPKVEQEGKLPILYTASTVGATRGEFVVAQQAIARRPDSRKYVEWKRGAAPSPDIYLFEKRGGDPFILASLLGRSADSDVVISLARDEQAVKDVICPPTKEPWITDDGWIEFEMEGLRCNSPRLLDYNHQIFVPGPPSP
ncbi:hypothetical protein MVEN_02447400 [Mycena venus]|uniref:Uncharacterized protein n=1 Tax=Mycena venus TaxID=2733690 RepID=A0A8H6WYP4_9AGAR|nr:hypothetical protein MVEN_02447400 [Mycena venus]